MTWACLPSAHLTKPLHTAMCIELSNNSPSRCGSLGIRLIVKRTKVRTLQVLLKVFLVIQCVLMIQYFNTNTKGLPSAFYCVKI